MGLKCEDFKNSTLYSTALYSFLNMFNLYALLIGLDYVRYVYFRKPIYSMECYGNEDSKEIQEMQESMLNNYNMTSR